MRVECERMEAIPFTRRIYGHLLGIRLSIAAAPTPATKMPKAGKFEFPYRCLDDCVDYLRKSYDKTRTEVSSRDTFAESLGMSSRGGGFGYLIGSMSMYNLVETGGGAIKFTDLAKLILYGEPHEVATAKEKAVRSIALFAEIYDRFQTNFNEDQLRLFLRERAGVDIEEAKTLADGVQKILRRDLQYLTVSARPGRAEEGAVKKTQPAGPELVSPALPEGVLAILQSEDFGVLKIKDEVGADIAIRMIEALKDRIRLKAGNRQEEGEK